MYGGFTVLFTLIYCLPFSHNGKLSIVDAFFLAASGISITGLTPFDLHSTLTFYGKLALLIEIQFGGIGIMVILSSFLLLLRQNLSISQQLLISFDTNHQSLKSIKKLVIFIFLYAFLLESIGAFFFYSYIKLHPTYSDTPFFLAVFHAVSSFTNAGFDLFGNGLVDYTHASFFLVMTAFLIVLGSLGFPSVFELVFKRRTKQKLSLFTKVNLVVHGTLLGIGTLCFLAIEYHQSFQSLPIIEKLANAFFLAATTRNAGFASIHLVHFSQASLILIGILMFIGGSASSCGGGIRVSTFFVLVSRTISTLVGRKEVVLFKKTLYDEEVQKAQVIFFSFLSLFGFSTFVLTLVEHQSIGTLAFEVLSALTTTGLSLGITSDLSTFSKLWLCGLMIIGRIGIIAFMYVLIHPKKTHIRYAKEHIIVG